MNIVNNQTNIAAMTPIRYPIETIFLITKIIIATFLLH